MMEFILWGTIIIVTTAITSIGIVLGIYYMLTKNKEPQKKAKLNYKLEDQKEIA
jgi:hypothetical protein